MEHHKKIPKLLSQIIEHLQDKPDRVAFYFLENNKSPIAKSCSEILTGAAAVANRLQNESKSNRALLIFHAGFDFIFALLGCFMSNTSAIPITIPKPKNRDLFLHFIDHSDPSIILTTSDLRARILQMISGRDTNRIRIVEVDKVPSLSTPFHIPKITTNAAIIQYTSGSIAFPKGVEISFDNLHHNLKAIKKHFGLNESTVSFSWLPHYHDMGLVDGILTPLYNQCTGIFCSPLTVVANPINWLKFITQFKVTHTGGPNFIFDLCVDRVTKADITSLDLKSLSHFYVSAEPVRKATLERFTLHFEETGFQSNQFTPGYGLAEATLMVTCKERNTKLNFLEVTEGGFSKYYTGLGKTIPGIILKIVDPETLLEKEVGEEGEIVLHGPTITRGYFNGASDTKKALVQLPGHDVAYFRTGDIGLVNNQELYVTGRLKDSIIIRGVQYHAEDLEYVASACDSRLLPSGTAAFGVNQEGGEELIILQEVKKEKWDSCNEGELKAKIKDAVFSAFGLSIFGLILVPQGAIPKTTSGKVRRKASRVKYEQQRFQNL